MTPIVGFIIEALILLIIADCIIANIIAFGGRISNYNPLVRIVRSIVNPILGPLRQVLPPYRTGGWDLTPLIAIIALQVLAGILVR